MNFKTLKFARACNCLLRASLVLGSALVGGCGGGGSSSSSSTTTTTTATSANYAATSTSTSTGTVGCSISDSGSSALTYFTMGSGSTTTTKTLAYNYNVSCSGNFRSLTGNGVPNHTISGGTFATAPAAQTISVQLTSNPDLTVAGTSYLSVSGKTMGNPGIAINTVKFDPATAGTCLNSATSATSGCDPKGNGGNWVMEALQDATVKASGTTWLFSFGTDDSNAHVQPNGQYHYHGMPEKLITKLNASSTTSMTLVGWAADGYPIYARYGYTTATSASSAIKVVTSNYRLKTTAELGATSSSRPSTTYFPLGHFTSDWKYDATHGGDLDECNGRYGVTPEFPGGTYHYYITDTYPFIQRCVKGTTVATIVSGA